MGHAAIRAPRGSCALGPCQGTPRESNVAGLSNYLHLLTTKLQLSRRRQCLDNHASLYIIDLMIIILSLLQLLTEGYTIIAKQQAKQQDKRVMTQQSAKSN